MTARLLRHALCTLAAPLCAPALAAPQVDFDPAIGQFYSVRPPAATDRFISALLVERLAPHGLTMLAPTDPLLLPVPLRALTGQIFEEPEHQRVYLTGVDRAGAIRLLEVDLMRRAVRSIEPPGGAGSATGAQLLAAPSRLYVEWFGPGHLPETTIYEPENLVRLGRTSDFLPDERAAGFIARAPYLWTLDGADRPVLIDTQRDAVAAVFDPQLWFGPVPAAVADAWRDLLLYRIDAGHDRFQVVDVRSGELGPPLDLPGYSRSRGRLALDGRFLVLLDMERRALGNLRSSRGSATAIAIGSGAVYDLRSGERAAEFRLVVPPDFPLAAVGSHQDPSLPGRLWIWAAGDQQRFDFDLPGCSGQRLEGGDRLQAELAVRWNPEEDPLLYRYALQVADSSPTAASALAINAGRETERSAAPEGWGMDLIQRNNWIRWTNALGPAGEDVAPGTARGGFIIAASRDTRPGIAAFRLQAAIGVPRSCESDDRFLDNALSGYTLAPEHVDAGDPQALARRLARLVGSACEIGWVPVDDCDALRAAAAGVEGARDPRAAAERFLAYLDPARLLATGRALLTDAARAITETVSAPP